MPGCFYSGLPLEQTIMEQMNAMIEATDDTGTPFWHGLTLDDHNYLIMTRTVREAKNLNLQTLGCIVAVVDIRAMIRSISSSAQQEAEEMAFWLDDQCLYRGTLCPQDGQEPELFQEKWQVMEQNGKKYFVTSVPFLQNRVRVINYIDYDLIYRALQASSLSILFGMLAALGANATLKTWDVDDYEIGRAHV